MTDDSESNHEINWTTERGTDVTITAESGKLYGHAESDTISIEKTSVRFGEVQGIDVLVFGTYQVEGEEQLVQVPIDDHYDEIKQLQEESKPDEGLKYRVIETTKPVRTDGWGSGETTVTKLSPNKSFAEMTDREQELNRRVDLKQDVPDGADPGETFTISELLDDPRTEEEREEAAIEEAREKGEEVTIWKKNSRCNDPSEECNLDKVRKVATPDGEIDVRRVHTY